MALQTKPIYKTTTENIGNTTIDFKTEYWDGEGFDTTVTIENHPLCAISWTKKDEFLKEFKALVEKYRI